MKNCFYIYIVKVEGVRLFLSQLGGLTGHLNEKEPLSMLLTRLLFLRKSQIHAAPVKTALCVYPVKDGRGSDWSFNLIVMFALLIMRL